MLHKADGKPDNSMRCLFVTNQLKTKFYEPLARRMSELGVTVYWISVSARWTRYLTEKGWPRNHILCLEDFGPEWKCYAGPTRDDLDRVKRIESLCETSLKNTLLMDRELNKRPGTSVEDYIYVITREIERFVVDHDIPIGFGEDTWAPEIVTWLVMASVGRRYLIPHSIRIPSTRFAFFNTVFHHTIERIRPMNDDDIAIATGAISEFRDRGERPFYFATRNNPQRLREHWIAEGLHHLLHPREGRYDHTVPSLLTRLGRRVRARLRVIWLRRTKLFSTIPDTTRPIIFFPLQLQPESSIDVYGNSLSNQVEVIKATARLLPFDWEIWVKEHPHALGDRPRSFYRDLRNIPSVRLIRYDVDSRVLIERSRIVASVSGTACMEAGIMGVPAITYAPMFFGDLLLRNGFNPFGSTHHRFSALLDEAERFQNDGQRDRCSVEQVSLLVANSFRGVVSDPISAPDCTADSNVRLVANAFVEMVDRVVAQRQLSQTPTAPTRLNA